MVFSKEWFKIHQRKLIWLLNAPLIKYWFRWVMCIRKFDCPIDVAINYIEPNAFWYGAKLVGKNKIKVTTDFRTDNKFSKRLYYAFKYIWWVMHIWDEIFADRMMPAYSFGFNTLTVYPNADPETTSVDGEVLEVQGTDQTWAAIRAGAGTSATPSAVTGYCQRFQSGTGTDTWIRL